MNAWGVTESEIREAARSVGLGIHSDWNGTGIKARGRSLQFRLALDTSVARDDEGFLPFQRQSTAVWHREAPRKIAAVCWHGHREFLRALFAVQPTARVKTALADYRGSDDFERKFEGTRGVGNGYHVSYDQACNCGE